MPRNLNQHKQIHDRPSRIKRKRSRKLRVTHRDKRTRQSTAWTIHSPHPLGHAGLWHLERHTWNSNRGLAFGSHHKRTDNDSQCHQQKHRVQPEIQSIEDPKIIPLRLLRRFIHWSRQNRGANRTRIGKISSRPSIIKKMNSVLLIVQKLE